MSITLSDGVTTLALPADMEWSDEYDWSPVVQEAGYSLTGALIVEASVKQAGRPVTLQSGDDRAWVTRADVDQLRAWAAIPGKALTLTLRGTARAVIFDHAAGAVEADMVMFYGDPVASDHYAITIKTIEV